MDECSMRGLSRFVLGFPGENSVSTKRCGFDLSIKIQGIHAVSSMVLRNNNKTVYIVNMVECPRSLHGQEKKDNEIRLALGVLI